MPHDALVYQILALRALQSGRYAHFLLPHYLHENAVARHTVQACAAASFYLSLHFAVTLRTPARDRRPHLHVLRHGRVTHSRSLVPRVLPLWVRSLRHLFIRLMHAPRLHWRCAHTHLQARSKSRTLFNTLHRTFTRSSLITWKMKLFSDVASTGTGSVIQTLLHFDVPAPPDPAISLVRIAPLRYALMMVR